MEFDFAETPGFVSSPLLDDKVRTEMKADDPALESLIHPLDLKLLTEVVFEGTSPTLISVKNLREETIEEKIENKFTKDRIIMAIRNLNLESKEEKGATPSCCGGGEKKISCCIEKKGSCCSSMARESNCTMVISTDGCLGAEIVIPPANLSQTQNLNGNNDAVPMTICPVSGHNIDEKQQHVRVIFSGGQKMYFCSTDCCQKFSGQPTRFLLTFAVKRSLSAPVCPVMNRPAYKGIKAVFKGGQHIDFCCQGCVQLFVVDLNRFRMTFGKPAAAASRCATINTSTCNLTSQNTAAQILASSLMGLQRASQDSNLGGCASNSLTQDNGTFTASQLQAATISSTLPNTSIPKWMSVFPTNHQKAGGGNIGLTPDDTMNMNPLPQDMTQQYWEGTAVSAVTPRLMPPGDNSQSKSKRSTIDMQPAPQVKLPAEKKRKFTCTLCDRNFANKSNLNRHQLVHTGERPFRCKHCGKTFTQRGNMNQHVRVHTGERPYKCGTCPRSFRQYAAFAKHLSAFQHSKPSTNL